MLADSAKWIRQTALAGALFLVLTGVMMWPQTRHIYDGAIPNQDVYFNMWRLQWIAHALSTSPGNLFNGNIFYPEPRTLAFSDAMLVQGAIAAPLSARYWRTDGLVERRMISFAFASDRARMRSASASPCAF